MISWLECEGLGSLCSIAREQGLDGSILLALHNEAKKENGTYKDDCTGLGITGLPLQLRLRGKLAVLFESQFVVSKLNLFLPFLLPSFPFPEPELQRKSSDP